MTRCSLGLVPVLVVFTSLSAPAAAQNIGPGNPPGSAGQNSVIGDGYVVKVRRGDAQQRLVGDLVKANDRWLVLHTRTLGNEIGVPAAPKNWLSPAKAFKNAGRETIDELLWIPRDAAVIERHIPRGSKLPTMPVSGEAPPRQSACTVELAAGYQVDRQEGNFLGWAGSDLALAQQSAAAPQRIAYGQILCLRFRQSEKSSGPSGIAAK